MTATRTQAQDAWTSRPICCPFCASDNIQELDKWKLQSVFDPDNNHESSEWQCEACEGRSFWA